MGKNQCTDLTDDRWEGTHRPCLLELITLERKALQKIFGAPWKEGIVRPEVDIGLAKCGSLI